MKYTLTSCLVLLAVAIVQENACQVASFQTSLHNNNHQYQQCTHDRTTSSGCNSSSTRGVFGPLRMASESDKDGGNDFWEQQKALMEEMSDVNEQSLKQENKKNFAKIQGDLITETVFFSSLLFSVLWLACDNPFVPLSYVFGSIFGIAYAYGLGKFVETVGGTIDDALTVEGAGVGQARFAFLILLFVFVGKFRAYGLMEIPSIAGFFTYQLASLSQGLKEEKIE